VTKGAFVISENPDGFSFLTDHCFHAYSSIMIGIGNAWRINPMATFSDPDIGRKQ